MTPSVRPWQRRSFRRIAGVLVASASAMTGCGFTEDQTAQWLADNPFGQAVSAALAGTLDRTDYAFSCGPGFLGFVVPDCPLGQVCFTEACEAHDQCYGTCGTTREQCDDLLLDIMLDTCFQHFGGSIQRQIACQVVAFSYQDVTESLGDESFALTQETCTRPPGAAKRAIVGIDGSRVYYAVSEEDVQSSLWMADADTGEVLLVHDEPGETVVGVSGNQLIIVRENGAPNADDPDDILAVDLETGEHFVMWPGSFRFTNGRFFPVIDGRRVAWIDDAALQVYDLDRYVITASVDGDFDAGFVDAISGGTAFIRHCPEFCGAPWLVDLDNGEYHRVPERVDLDDRRLETGTIGGARLAGPWLVLPAYIDGGEGDVEANVLAHHVPTRSWRRLAAFANANISVLEVTDTDTLVAEQFAQQFPRMFVLRLHRIDLTTGEVQTVADLSGDPAIWGIDTAFDSPRLPGLIPTGGRLYWIDQRFQELVVYDLVGQARWTVALEGEERMQNSE